MFACHSVRTVRSLSGLWDFAILDGIDCENFVPQELRAALKMPVPSAFDAYPGFHGRRGAALYQTVLAVPPGQPALLDFGAVSIWSRVFVEGELLHENACGYAPFRVRIPPSAHPRRLLSVLVDNRFDPERAPMHEDFFDFYQYGGILRDVRLHLLPANAPWIASVQVTPAACYEDGEVEMCVRLDEETASRQGLRLIAAFDDAEPFEIAWEEAAAWRAKVPRPKTWSPENPHLHSVRVILTAADGTAIDDVGVRFGLRRIEAREGRLWLNGQPLQLRGYNRHEWHPSFGPCTPPLQMSIDLAILRDLGCNFIRGAHYPQDQQFLDLCDELGFLVWEENLGWQNPLSAMSRSKFQKDHRQALEAMVACSYNHPSVIIWGFLNEAETDCDEIRPLLRETVDTLRRLDPSRLVSYASRFAETDRHFDLVDLIAINVYPGWYDCESADQPLDLIRPQIEQCCRSIDERGFRDKPIVITEIGAEALYGWHDVHHDFFTEEYQAEYLRRACAAILGHPRCSGLAIWLFSDTRTRGKGRSLQRPRTFNNKGTLDEYRRPKAACQAVAEAFGQHKSRTSF